MTPLTGAPSRREKQRTATVVEIKESARQLLVSGGPAAISLRAIARDMGMTAPAIYRYFENLDALVLTIVTDLFEELRISVEQVAAAHAAADPLTRVGHMARGFRRWSLDHPAEFALMFGSPVPSVTQFAAICGPAKNGSPINDAGARFGETFFTVLDEFHRENPIEVTLPDLPDQVFQPYVEMFGDRFPMPVVYLFISAWTRLYGIVAMEVFGHLRWAMTDVEPMFELELARTVQTLAR